LQEAPTSGVLDIQMLYTPPQRSERLPIVDLAPSFSDGPAGALAVAREIRRCVCDTGFFYVKNHGVEQAVVEAAFDQARRVLGMPQAAKDALKRVPGKRGYEGLGGQATGIYTAPDGVVPIADLKESFNFGRDRGPRTTYFSEEQWPAGLHNFREPAETYYTAVDELAQHLIRLLALSLDLPVTYFDEAFQYPQGTCRMLRYPPHEGNAVAGQLGAGAHTDIGAITILAQDQHEGLEVRNRNGQWILATPIAGTFVVNIADMFERWTNDLYVSSMHRVMNNGSTEDRYSIVFFFGPAYYTRIECIPTCASPDHPPKYEPVIYGEQSAARLAQSYQFTPTRLL
jgi:isopenicillin N synthase-like dioxygenase